MELTPHELIFLKGLYARYIVKDYRLALELFAPLAEKRMSFSQNMMGVCYAEINDETYENFLILREWKQGLWNRFIT